MKIVEVIPDLAFGGAERFVTDLCNSLSNNNNQVTLITFFNIDKKESFFPLLSNKIRFVCLNKKVGLSLTLPFILLYNILKEKPQVVHTHLNCIDYCILAWILLRRISFIHTVHNDAIEEAGGSLGLMIRKLAFGRFVKPVTISNESQKSFWSLYKKESTLIHNGRPKDDDSNYIDSNLRRKVDSLRSSNQTFIIINIARFAAQKNQLSLVKAVNIVNKDIPKVDLLLVGSFNHSQDAMDIYNTIQKVKTEHIHILGAKSDATQYLKYADAFCLSSVFEGMPISIIESFAYGCPVLSTPVGGVVDMVEDKVNGMLSKDTSIESIAEMIDDFCRLAQSDRELLSKNAKKAYEKYSMDLCVRNYLLCFRK